MKQALKGFHCEPETALLLGDTHELELFLQTVCYIAGIDPYIDDTPELLATLDEQVKTLFSPELVVTALDADNLTPASRKSEEIYILISPINHISVH